MYSNLKIDREKHLLGDRIHLTKQGRDMVAEKIAIFLKQKKLIPKRPVSY